MLAFPMANCCPHKSAFLNVQRKTGRFFLWFSCKNKENSFSEASARLFSFLISTNWFPCCSWTSPWGQRNAMCRAASCFKGDGITWIRTRLPPELGVTVSPDVQEKSHTCTWIRALLGRGEREMEMGALRAANNDHYSHPDLPQCYRFFKKINSLFFYC